MLTFATRPELTREARALLVAAGAVQTGACTFESAMERLSFPDFSGMNLPSEDGAKLGKELSRLAGHPQAACDSCAFRLGTIPNQCATTLLQAMECLITGEPFLCHKTGQPCEGWKATRT